MKHRWKKAGALLLAVLLAAGTLTACSPEEAASSTLEETNQLRLENDGEEASLVVAERFFSTERTAALEEIAEKYMADFPQTRIEIVTVESGEEAMGMLQSGEADLVELSEQEQPAAVEQGLLTELSLYLDVWEERSTLTAAAKQAVASMGADFAYLLPATLNQDLVYYTAIGSRSSTRARRRAWSTAAFGRTLPTPSRSFRTRGRPGWCSVGRTAWWTCSTPSCGAP